MSSGIGSRRTIAEAMSNGPGDIWECWEPRDGWEDIRDTLDAHAWEISKFHRGYKADSKSAELLLSVKSNQRAYDSSCNQ
jgi:hypothetical protein